MDSSVKSHMSNTQEDLMKTSLDKLDTKCRIKNFIKVKDWRRLAYCFKVGLALTIVSLSVLLEDIHKKIGDSALWAILTVVVVFEYTIGGTLSKGLNRGLGTIVAACLGLLIDYLVNFLGPNFEPYVVGFSIFIVGFISTYARTIPSIKAKFDYGMVIFLLTFCLVIISGYRVSNNIDVVIHRIVTVIMGIVICLIISVFIFPMWAGDDLHKLVIKNFEDLANSLEECLHQYFEGIPKLDRLPSTICKGQPHDDNVYKGYRGILNSKQTQESLVVFASWELKRGRFGLTYPWKKLVEASAIVRHCAYTISALHGCVLSEIQAPTEVRKVFARPCMRVGDEVVSVFREVAIDITHSRKCRPKDHILEKVYEAINDLKRIVKTYKPELLQYPNSKNNIQVHDGNDALSQKNDNDVRELEKPCTSNQLQESTIFIQSLSVASVIVLLIEIATRLENLINAIIAYQQEAGLKRNELLIVKVCDDSK